MVKRIDRFLLDDRGSTAIEYALIVALVALVAVAAISSMTTALNGAMTTIATNLNPSG